MCNYVYPLLLDFTRVCLCLQQLLVHVSPMFTRLYSCLTMLTLGYLCLPLFAVLTYVYLCMFTYVYPCLLVFTYVYTCLPMFTPVYSCYPCLLVFNYILHFLIVHVYLCLPPRFTRVYLCLHLFTYVSHVSSCLPMFTRAYLCLPLFTRTCLRYFQMSFKFFFFNSSDAARHELLLVKLLYFSDKVFRWY